jgi:serine/threonine protein kinase, bacterial
MPQQQMPQPQRAAYAPQTQQAAYRPPQQQQQRPSVPAQAAQRPMVAPAPLRQAPRQPRPSAAYDPVPKNGIGCLGRIAILLIVLALAALIGVEIGNRIAKDRGGEPVTHRLGISVSRQLAGFRGSAL